MIKSAVKFLAIIPFLVTITAAHSAEITTDLVQKEIEMGCTVAIRGQISIGDAVKIKKLNLPEGWKHHDKAFCLDSPGGNLAEAIEISVLIINLHYGTAIAENSTCESACAIIFMSGVSAYVGDLSSHKSMHPTAKLGFHAPKLAVKNENYNQSEVILSYNIALETISKLIEIFGTGAPYEFPFEILLSTPNNQMWYVDEVYKALALNIEVKKVNLPEIGKASNLLYACYNLITAKQYLQLRSIRNDERYFPFNEGFFKNYYDAELDMQTVISETNPWDIWEISFAPGWDDQSGILTKNSENWRKDIPADVRIPINTYDTYLYGTPMPKCNFSAPYTNFDFRGEKYDNIPNIAYYSPMTKLASLSNKKPNSSDDAWAEEVFRDVLYLVNDGPVLDRIKRAYMDLPAEDRAKVNSILKELNFLHSKSRAVWSQALASSFVGLLHEFDRASRTSGPLRFKSQSVSTGREVRGNKLFMTLLDRQDFGLHLPSFDGAGLLGWLQNIKNACLQNIEKFNRLCDDDETYTFFDIFHRFDQDSRIFIQSCLARMDLYFGEVDGNWSREMPTALRRFVTWREFTYKYVWDETSPLSFFVELDEFVDYWNAYSQCSSKTPVETVSDSYCTAKVVNVEADDVLNVRSEPNHKAPKVGWYASNYRSVEVKKIWENGWVSTEQGFVNSKYLQCID